MEVLAYQFMVMREESIVSKIRVGVIGAGYMGRAHAICYLEDPDAEVAMVAASRAERAEGLAKHVGSRWTTDWEEVISDPGVDVIDICTPNHLHLPIALAAIRHRKPFLIEKPLARNVDEALQIVKEQEESGVLAVYGENLRFAPAYVKAKEIIDQGGIGKVIMLRINEIHNGPFHSNWFWNADQTGGGALIDMGIHGLYMAEWLAGDRVESVYSEVGTLKWHDKCINGAEDTAFSILRFQNGAMAEVVNSWAASGGIDVRVEIYGTAGTIYVDVSRNVGLRVYSERGYGKPLEVEAAERPHVSSSVGWSTPVPDEWQVHGHLPEIRHFLDCVRGKSQPLCTLREGLRALELVEALYKSAKVGRRVAVCE